MLTHIPTKKYFENRLEAKRHFGHSEFDRRLRNREFLFISKTNLPLMDKSENNTK